MQYSKTDNLITLIADDHIFVGHLAVGGMTRFFVVDIQCVGLSVVRQSDGVLRSSIDGWNQFQILLNIRYGHTCLLFSKDRMRWVRNAVMIKPSLSCSR